MSFLAPIVGRKYRLTFQNTEEDNIECEGCPLTVEAVCTDVEDLYLVFVTQHARGCTSTYEFFKHVDCGNKSHWGKWWDEDLWTQLVLIEEVGKENK